MTVNWQDTITALGGATIFLGAAAWLIRSIVIHLLSKDVETFKAKLKAEADGETEKLRNALQIAASEHQIRFAKLYEKRAVVIADFYSLLIGMHDAGAQFAFDSRSDDLLRVADEKRRTLFSFYAKHRIYFPEDVCQLLDRMINEISGLTVTVDVYRGGYYPTPQARQDWNDTMIKVVKAYETELPKLQRAIDAAFRKLLGETPPTL